MSSDYSEKLEVLKSLEEVHPELWWLDTDPLEPDWHPGLIGDIEADLCIVGAGYTGLWTALIAKTRNPTRSVVIVEAQETGAGASGRNGGFCSTSLTHGFVNGMARFPKEMETIERLGRENLDAIEATIKKFKIECGWERTGELRVATEHWQMDQMVEEALERNRLGDNVEVLNQEQIQKRVASPTYKGAIFDHDGTAMVDPARLVWGLERACIKLGVKIYENSKVLSLAESGEEIIARSPYGSVRAKRVALATNVAPSLIRSARKYVIPVYDYVMVTEPLTRKQRAAIGWKGREGISDAGNQFHYYRLTEDGSILWGGYDAIYRFRGKIAQEFDFNAESYATLAEHFFTTFPQLKGLKFTHAWGGAIDTCSRFSPFWGTAYGSKVGYVLGFTGLGVGATRFGAEAMLDLIDGVDSELTRLKMVRRKPFPFPPEPLRYPIIKFTQWSIQRADKNGGRRNLWLRLLDALGLGFDS